MSEPVPHENLQPDQPEQVQQSWEALPAEQRSELLNYYMSNPGIIDQNDLYMMAIRHNELLGINTRSPTTWIAPETQAFYQNTVEQSAKESAARQAEYDALTSAEKIQLQLDSYIAANSVVAPDAVKLGAPAPGVGDVAGDVIFTDFSSDAIRSQMDVMNAAIKSGDARVTKAGLATWLGFQNSALKGSVQSEIIASVAAGGSVASNFVFTDKAGGGFDVSYTLSPAASTVVDNRGLGEKTSDFFRDLGGGLGKLSFASGSSLMAASSMQKSMSSAGMDVMPLLSEGERQSVYYAGLAAAAATGIVAAPAMAAAGAVIGTGLTQGIKAGQVYFDPNVDNTLSNILLTPGEAFESAAVSAAFAGILSFGSSTLGLTHSLRAEGFTRLAVQDTLGKMGLAAGMGGATSGALEQYHTGSVTLSNVAFGAGVAAAFVGAGELAGYAGGKVQSKIQGKLVDITQQRLDNSYAKFSETAKPGDSWRLSPVDNLLSKMTGVNVPKGVMSDTVTVYNTQGGATGDFILGRPHQATPNEMMQFLLAPEAGKPSGLGFTVGETVGSGSRVGSVLATVSRGFGGLVSVSGSGGGSVSSGVVGGSIVSGGVGGSVVSGGGRVVGSSGQRLSYADLTGLSESEAKTILDYGPSYVRNFVLMKGPIDTGVRGFDPDAVSRPVELGLAVHRSSSVATYRPIGGSIVPASKPWTIRTADALAADPVSSGNRVSPSSYWGRKVFMPTVGGGGDVGGSEPLMQPVVEGDSSMVRRGGGRLFRELDASRDSFLQNLLDDVGDRSIRGSDFEGLPDRVDRLDLMRRFEGERMLRLLEGESSSSSVGVRGGRGASSVVSAFVSGRSRRGRESVTVSDEAVSVLDLLEEEPVVVTDSGSAGERVIAAAAVMPLVVGGPSGSPVVSVVDEPRSDNAPGSGFRPVPGYNASPGVYVAEEFAQKSALLDVSNNRGRFNNGWPGTPEFLDRRDPVKRYRGRGDKGGRRVRSYTVASVSDMMGLRVPVGRGGSRSAAKSKKKGKVKSKGKKGGRRSKR